jgi:phosphopentomutase
MHPIPRAFLIVLDSVGIGEAPDAAAYNDTGANTLAHTASAAGGLSTPTLQSLGLGNIPPLLPKGLPIAGVPATLTPRASFGALQEASVGKDTTTGHWEMAGLELTHGFATFPPQPPSFPPHLIRTFEQRTGRPVIGNCAASGTAIIADLGARHMREGCWIVYTSADSVLQIAVHEAVIPLRELYAGCAIARELCNPLRVGRVIARPFVGSPGAFTRTDNRRDFGLPLPEPTLLDHLTAAGIPVTTVGKLDDIFNGQGICRAIHVENNPAAQAALLDIAATDARGFFFANLIDFDMRFGHRRDAPGYARALEDTDRFLAKLLPALQPADLLIITADHGNDPTFRGTDHTREYVPLLVYSPSIPGGANLGIRKGFYDIARSLAEFFGIRPPAPRGTSFLPQPQS